MLDNIVKQLVDIYLNHNGHHVTKLSEEESVKYFTNLVKGNNIIVWYEKGVVKGYVEFWRLTYEQLGRVLCGEHFNACTEDICNGDICYVSDIFVFPEYRSPYFDKASKIDFFNRNIKCKHFVWERRTKKVQPLKVFSRSKFMDVLLRGTNGKR